MKYVSINGHTIRSKHGTDSPPIRIANGKNDRNPIYAREIAFDGPSRLVYSPACAILNCGARLVFETEDVKIIR